MNFRSVHYVLLGILSTEPKHGYQIHKELNAMDGIGAVWKIKITNVYALLDVLEREGYIRPSKRIEDESGYPPKKFFEITEKGNEIYRSWVHEPVKHGREIRQVFLSKLFFTQTENKQLAHQLILDQLSECNRWITNSKPIGEGERSEFRAIVESFRSMQIKSCIAWLKELEKEVEKTLSN